MSRLGQVVALVALAIIGRENVKSIAVNVYNLVGLFSGTNAFFPEAGEPDEQAIQTEAVQGREGFTAAL
ncbi:hypothetical protein [Aminiphilus circumscriptus]|uniref:hypothetical protein n=1 Tax=Aminiphilus circumscriptus TaxID=290732 RepID=UPI0012F7C4FA|nr:hypothetical protein [Aminiphilus circumscriptus]